jgi:hypothetical protein
MDFPSKEAWPSTEELNKLVKDSVKLEWHRYDDNIITVRVGNVDLKRAACPENQRSSIAKICRQLNNSQQTQRRGWRLMYVLSKSMEDLITKQESSPSIEWKGMTESNILEEKPGMPLESELRRRIEKNETELMNFFQSMASKTMDADSCVFVPGPVGDLPIHVCFLLDLTEFGEKLIDKFFNSPKLLSLPYTNDLDAWRDRPKDSSSREDGLYTGETVLHIAIVKENRKLVQFLTNKGIDLSSRATGAFFQPKWIRPRVDELTTWQWLMAKLGGIDLSVDIFAAVKEKLNEYSG